jgi:hypothetical protein
VSKIDEQTPNEKAAAVKIDYPNCRALAIKEINLVALLK